MCVSFLCVYGLRWMGKVSYVCSLIKSTHDAQLPLHPEIHTFPIHFAKQQNEKGVQECHYMNKYDDHKSILAVLSMYDHQLPLDVKSVCAVRNQIGILITRHKKHGNLLK